MENKKYKVVIAQSGKLDVKEKKKYILQQFKYREYAENFSKKIKKAVLALDTLPTGYNTTGFRYRGYDIYMKPCESYLLFYTVDEAVKTVTVLRVMQDGMDWQYIINRWRGKTHRIYKKVIVTGSIQTDWVPPVFMSAENRWTAEEKY